MISTSRLARESIRKLEPSVHGGELRKVASKTGLRKEDILDFSSSINPIGPSEKALKAIRSNLKNISSYPDSDSCALREAIANHFSKISKDNVIIGNGSTELIYLFVETFMQKGDVALIPAPTFSEYERAVKKVGEKPKHVKLNLDFSVYPAVFVRELSGAKIAFLCNPNNPTSILMSPESLTAIVERAFEDDALIFFG